MGTSEQSRRRQLGERVMAVEGRWLMGRFAPREVLQGVGRYLHRVAPEREEELLGRIRERAAQLAEEDEDLPVDGPSRGMLALTAVILAAYETLLPLFDGDERRTIRYLQRVFGAVLRRSVDAMFGKAIESDDPLTSVADVCQVDFAMYGSYYDVTFERTDELFEMRIGRCFFRDYFARHGNPLLTTVLCAWDANWMAALDPAVGGLRAERPTLLSLGDDACRFRVLRTDDPLAEYGDALDERFGPQEGPVTESGR